MRKIGTKWDLVETGGEKCEKLGPSGTKWKQWRKLGKNGTKLDQVETGG